MINSAGHLSQEDRAKGFCHLDTATLAFWLHRQFQNLQLVEEMDWDHLNRPIENITATYRVSPFDLVLPRYEPCKLRFLCGDGSYGHQVECVDFEDTDGMAAIPSTDAHVRLLPAAERERDLSADEAIPEWLLEEEHDVQ